MKVAFLGERPELAERLGREGLEVEVVPLAEAEAVVVEAEGPEVSRLVADSPVPVIWLVPARSRELMREAHRLGVFGLLSWEDEPWSMALLLESAARAGRERRELSRRVKRLEKALEERKTIERAKGWLMDRYGLKEKEAFSRLRRLAMDARRPLAEVAEMVLLVGEAGKGTPAG